jgi:hypothetical protein
MIAPPGSEIRVGVGHPVGSVSPRCRATHDVPYSLRCIHSAGHGPLVKHQDKEGNEW